MNREVLSYSDLSYDSSGPVRQASNGYPQHSSQFSNQQHHNHNHNRGRGQWRGRGNGNAHGGGGGRGRGRGHEAGGTGRVDSSEDDGRANKRRRKFEESPDHDRVHWDAQGQKRQGDIEVSYDDVGTSMGGLVTSRPLIGEVPGDNSAANGSAKGDNVPSKTQAVNLTSSDAWDDSDLISAWDAAIEEYHILNGPEKDWKAEPVHKNSIWYSESERMKWKDVKDEPPVTTAVPVVETPQQQDEFDDAMFDSEDEGIIGGVEDGTDAVQMASATEDQYKASTSALPDVSDLTSEELFQKAVEASYWAGYWAGAYRKQAKSLGTEEEAEC
ncbi:hypothetical protein FRB96_006169 [Tulasnella sp. 330]|nr:hypothetical protein FRB96_006169 [Tulasnella sp. 330]